jgi:O-succinylbenzoic acid--CoA ligase
VHELRVVDASDVAAVTEALREALAGGPALLPKDARARRTDEANPLPAEVDDAIALMIETSGSTGAPKRVVLSAAALRAAVAAAHARLGGEGQWLLALPLTYIAGVSVVMRALIAKTELVVLPPGHFDAQNFVEHARLLEAPRRYTSLVPVQLARLIEFAESDSDARDILTRFDAILVGGQALEAGVASRASALGLNVMMTYGSSETSGGCVYDGLALEGVQLRVDTESSQEIWVSSPTLAEGYWGDAAATHDRFVVADGIRWYRTGDAGELVDGTLRITGRLDRVVISGGLKISLDAVEVAARQVEGCESLVAVSMPNSEWGHCPALVVEGIEHNVARDEVDEALYSAVVAALGRAAAPRVILHVPSLPRLANGKVDLVLAAEMVRETAH